MELPWAQPYPYQPSDWYFRGKRTKNIMGAKSLKENKLQRIGLVGIHSSSVRRSMSHENQSGSSAVLSADDGPAVSDTSVAAARVVSQVQARASPIRPTPVRYTPGSSSSAEGRPVAVSARHQVPHIRTRDGDETDRPAHRHASLGHQTDDSLGHQKGDTAPVPYQPRAGEIQLSAFSQRRPSGVLMMDVAPSAGNDPLSTRSNEHVRVCSGQR